MHENTIDKKGALEREYANDVASLKNDLEEEQDTVASLEEQLETFEVSQNEIFSKLTKERDHAKAQLKLLKNEKSKVGVGHDKLVKDLDDLDKAHKALESEHSILTKSHEQLQASYLKEHAMLPTLLNMSCDDACATNSTSCEASILKENVELRAQLELLTSNYGKLEENHGKLSSSHEDLLASHDRLKLAHEAIISKATPCEPHVDISTSTQNAILPCASPSNSSTHNIAKSCDELSSLPCCSNNEGSTSSSTCVVTNHVEEIKELKAQVNSLKNDLVKSHEGKCKLDTMLSVQQSPNDKSGLGFKSNNKDKSKNNKNKKGQVQVKDPAKIVCFKCKIEGHHVRSFPLKKKQKGKRPQAQTHIQPQVEEMPLPKKNQANAPIVEKSSEKKEKKRTCYICREKGHISSFCTIGTSSNSITIDDVYSLHSINPKPQSEGIAESTLDNWRRLWGNFGTRQTSAVTSAAFVLESPTPPGPKDPIYCEPFEFASHLKPSHPAPSESSDDMTTTFGGVHFIIDSGGFLRLPRTGRAPSVSTEDTRAATLEIPPRSMHGGNRGNLDHATGRKKRRRESYYGEREQEGMQSIHGRARSPHLSATEQLDAPCYLHSYIDPKDGREKSSHLLRNCRHFLEIRQFCDDLRSEAISRVHIMEKKARSYDYRAEPYIPEPYEPMEKDEYVPAEVFPEPRGQVSMIHKTSFSKREIKKFSREVKYAEVAMVDTPEFINWSEQSISFDRSDHPKAVPRPGHAALVLEAQIGGYNMSKVFMDGGSGLNLLFANTMKAMGLTVDMLRESDTGFHGIIPTRPAYSLGKTSLDVVFGTPTNFRREKIEFEVVDWESQYHAILGRPAFAKFMAVPHYAYLKLKMPGNNGTPITVHGSFARSDTCDREFQKIASKFGAKEELNAIDAAVDHTQPPADNRNVRSDEFDAAKEAKKLQVHPTDPKKTVNISADLTAA
ncbi:hypothetical protein QYE76_037209 [Lolium multiflorum]|uniref:CCHC-type domain-containing protein n=1 Tax=Lolium multiflorum TaxID=4521 RepID=A0AAD8V2C0_LOLMU|nr:hypothetical protein QYE76_037209 [Lolium multiflorum]